MAPPRRKPAPAGKKTGKEKSEEKVASPDINEAQHHHHEPEGGYGDFAEPPVVQRVAPPDQLNLEDKDLGEEITRALKGNNPNAPQNIIRYSNKEKQFKLDASVEQLAVHFEMEGWLLHKDTDEAQRIVAAEQAEQDAIKKLKAAEAEGDGDKELSDAQLRNQFNFSERATQTFNNQLRDRSCATEPPPTSNFSETVSQWEIFDSYSDDLERQKMVKEKKAALAKKHSSSEDKEEDAASLLDKDSKKKDNDPIHSESMRLSSKIMERMVNQNTYEDIAEDYKYWEDESDRFKDGEGTLLPLWKFYTEKAKKKHVTSMCWNPEYNDMFAVGYGSYDFMKQGGGLICVWSLKNPSSPEFSFTTESGVMCLDFHPQHSSLLAVGLYDGTVMVYDIRSRVNKPIFQSTVKTGKHTDPVWEIHWQEEDLAKSLNFISVSTDGRVVLWEMSKNELTYQDIMELKLVGISSGIGSGSGGGEDGVDPDEETSLCGLAGGCCFDFHKTSDHLFLVGTEEGMIHKCSKAYNSQYLETYEGHHMAVYGVRFNHHHNRTFLSASADWTVKLWDHQQKNPLLSFDLGNAVGDVAWAPYSSTVFAAITNDGKVHVFDLNENRHDPLCDQKVVRKAKLTHLRFNPREPFLIVGDDHGCVNAMKLSPNLRKPPPPPKEGETVQEKEVESGKMDKVLALLEKGENN
uniref:Uncharacterized protein n=1 Tax=Palpitomonas bilix TaxID=652834 RepID=A0A7S3GGM1_9EUKA|mmetsp:Transcript_4856/g.10248  ORF Transcript_4856/g.10248 Transcript_4856/m.10248 type:complete len:689 (+) Transcript_4856:138-2204(+)|eukprot:CAMPEP_0113916790 /NCGR_PEP_ID=MMETSP0780_2-20120614/32282_1 /TAXON_ID=652834 /ORGANISM="Palpitomonas bilix" /LENGTH=688 /DNA_ID=CAMNT_0000916107 /DNA_START=139 /DNA_END=2205 /DNA_ORIENTATION=+ /assembly_acc=CAM_ASM_000599